MERTLRYAPPCGSAADPPRAGSGRVTKEKLENIEVTINDAVAALFERYPFRAGAGTSAAPGS
jgi:hypothetical protein